MVAVQEEYRNTTLCYITNSINLPLFDVRKTFFTGGGGAGCTTAGLSPLLVTISDRKLMYLKNIIKHS